MPKEVTNPWDSFQGSIRESFFRNAGVPYRNLIGLLLGFTSTVLLLSSGALTIFGASLWFVGLLAVTMVSLVAVRPYREKKIDHFAWGLLVIVILGFGLGALEYQTRSWWIWVWRQYLRINTAPELLLEALFLLGVILGFFVVRNWAKEQKDFVSSLSAVLSGAFVATILGKLQDNGPEGIGPLKAFAYYALGFTMSGTVNLIAAARLTASYTNKRSIASRAMLDFLYGSERAIMIDGYFLKNFKDDPDYAKRLLTNALVEWRKAVQNAFAGGLEKRRSHREGLLKENEIVNQAASDENRKLLREFDPACSKLKETREDVQELQDELEKLKSIPDPRPRKKAGRLRYIEERMVELNEDIRQLEDKCGIEQFKQWSKLKDDLSQIKPTHFYELIAVECDEKKEEEEKAETINREDLIFTIVYKKIGTSRVPKIEPEMFRVGVTVRWEDMLQYISAPGEYRQPFPYPGSVSGLALEFRKTIVMDRDLYKRFRNTKHTDGICPKDIEQNRGLDEIDYLSYIAIPIVSRPGSAEENPLGVVTIDTKLFVSRSELQGQPLKAAEGIFRMRIKRSKLTGYANNLYDHEDIDVKFIESLTKIITPVLDLYSKCRVGAT